MKIYQGRWGAGGYSVAILLLLCSCGVSAASDVAPRLFDCSISQRKMVASSNQALMKAERVPEKDLRIEAEKRDGNIALHLYDSRQTPSPDTPGAGNLGWVTYDPVQNRLTDVNDDPLTFNQEAGKRYQRCLLQAAQCQSLLEKLTLEPIQTESPRWIVTGKSRSWFYSAPVEQCRSESVFVISGDTVQVVGLGVKDKASQQLLDNASEGERHGYLLVQFNDVVGWMRADRLVSEDEICDDAVSRSEGCRQPVGK